MTADKSTTKKTTAKRVVRRRRKPRALKTEAPKAKSSETPEPVSIKGGKAGKYYEAVGRRKTAIARVRIFPQKGGGEFSVNGKPIDQYFYDHEMQGAAKDALNKMSCSDQFAVSVKLTGGGLHAQAEAVRHGISRALILFNPEFKKRLKKAGFLTRDPRMRERKKFGLKRARRAPQWQKR